MLNRRDVILWSQQRIIMTSSLYKKIEKILFINGIPKIKATDTPSFAAPGSLIFTPATYPFLLINKAGGSFHSLPLPLLLPLANPYCSSSAAATERTVVFVSGRCITLNQTRVSRHPSVVDLYW